MSYVYFIRSRKDGLIKIGFSTDAVRRIGEFEGGASKYEMIGVIEGDRKTEAALHRRFYNHRNHGEWFNPHSDIMEFVKRTSTAPTKKAREMSKDWSRLVRVLQTISDNDLADKCGVSLKTAQNWKSGRNEPNAHHLVEMMTQFPIMYEAVQIVAGRPSKIAQRAYAEMVCAS